MPLSQILDGVEAAHLLGATHRDLKPENILLGASGRPAIADFGIAAFSEDYATLVQTGPTTRLANFQYAAPEQRTPGRTVTKTADIYALGLILNEIFTGEVPHGSSHQTIGARAGEYGFLDAVVEAMMRQSPADRPQSVALVKQMIERHRADAITHQKISTLERTVVPDGDIENPLAHEAPKLIGAEWGNGTLRLKLDRAVNSEWIQALQNMGSYTSVIGAEPARFHISGDNAVIGIHESAAQIVIDHFKAWLPVATQTLFHTLTERKRQEDAERRARLKNELESERRRLEVNRSLRI